MTLITCTFALLVLAAATPSAHATWLPSPRDSSLVSLSPPAPLPASFGAPDRGSDRIHVREHAAPLSAPLSSYGWSLDSTPLWADFGHNGVPGNPCAGANCVLTDAQAAFIANTYQIVSLEKCFGIKWGTPGNKTEHNFIQAVAQLKAANPNVKVLLYWNVPLVIGECYDTAATFLNHTDWWLKDDQGQVVHPDPVPTHLFVDFTVPAAAQWWISVPLQLVAQSGADGVFLDGTGGQDYAGMAKISQQRSDEINAKAMAAVAAYRAAAKSVQPDLLVIGNGLTEYPYPPDHGMAQLAYLDGVCIEHFGAFEGVDSDNASLYPTNLVTWAQLTAAAVQQNKSVLVKAWVGPETTPIDGMGPTWPATHRPPLNRTHAGIAQAAAANLLFPHSLFLCLVEQNVYFSYAWWYDLMQGYIPCPETPGGCDCPDDFFPSLHKRIGSPLTPPTWSGFECRREFEHASVYVDVSKVESASIVWK